MFLLRFYLQCTFILYSVRKCILEIVPTHVYFSKKIKYKPILNARERFCKNFLLILEML